MCLELVDKKWPLFLDKNILRGDRRPPYEWAPVLARRRSCLCRKLGAVDNHAIY